MDQVGCQYVPHVMGLMVGQAFKVLNSDGILHNVHALSKVNRPFNMAMPPTRKEASETFTKEEGMFTVKCDVHPWMRSYISVSSHPFFAVTGEDGSFTIKNLPAGEYESRQQSFGGLGTAIIVAVAGVLAVLVLEFRTFRSTLIVASVIKDRSGG